MDARDERRPRRRGTRRHVDDGLLERGDPEPCDVADDANHRERSRLERRLLIRARRYGGQVVGIGGSDAGVRVEVHDLAERIGIGPQGARGRFGHDRHRQIRRALGRRERPPAHHRDIEHAEVFRRDELVRDRRLGAAGLRERRPWRVRPRRGHGGDRRLGRHRLHDRLAGRLVHDLDDDGVGGPQAGIERAPRQTRFSRTPPREISSSADALTCTPIRRLRARPGRASLTTSPRIVRIGSMRVACSAGASPKHIVEMAAPTMRNSATRQSASGTINRISPISGGKLRHHRVDDGRERHARDREAGRRGDQRQQQALRQQLADDAAARRAK